METETESLGGCLQKEETINTKLTDIFPSSSFPFPFNYQISIFKTELTIGREAILKNVCFFEETLII
jgi:hypothetical protein